MNVYFISGLAADSRVFKHIELPTGFKMQHLHWIAPLKNEPLQSYSLRLAASIDQTQPFVLVGLSLGGMIATEIARVYPPLVTVLISSITTYKQLPPHYKLARFLGLHRIVPINLLKAASSFKRDFCPDAEADKIILKQVIRESDPSFVRWAMGAILSWRNEEIPAPLWHIHGTRDEILPIRYTNPTHTVDRANHLMVMSQAPRLNQFLRDVLPAL